MYNRYHYIYDRFCRPLNTIIDPKLYRSDSYITLYLKTRMFFLYFLYILFGFNQILNVFEAKIWMKNAYVEHKLMSTFWFIHRKNKNKNSYHFPLFVLFIFTFQYSFTKLDYNFRILFKGLWLLYYLYAYSSYHITYISVLNLYTKFRMLIS